MRKSNGRWYVRFVVDGVEYSKPTGLAATEHNRKKAERMEAADRQLVIEGKAHLLRISAIPFSEAATQFLKWAEGEYKETPESYRRIRSSFAFIRHHFGRAIVASLTAGHIEDFKSARRELVRDISLRHDLQA